MEDHGKWLPLSFLGVNVKVPAVRFQSRVFGCFFRGKTATQALPVGRSIDPLWGTNQNIIKPVVFGWNPFVYKIMVTIDISRSSNSGNFSDFSQSSNPTCHNFPWNSAVPCLIFLSTKGIDSILHVSLLVAKLFAKGVPSIPKRLSMWKSHLALLP